MEMWYIFVELCLTSQITQPVGNYQMCQVKELQEFRLTTFHILNQIEAFDMYCRVAG